MLLSFDILKGISGELGDCVACADAYGLFELVLHLLWLSKVVFFFVWAGFPWKISTIYKKLMQEVEHEFC